MKTQKIWLSNPLISYFLVIISILLNFTNAFSYAPPIGIPDPGMWGDTHPIEGRAPSASTKCPDWPAAQTVGCYYVDSTHPSATDATNTYGYPNKPRLTPPGTGANSSFAYTYPAGAYVEIHGGPYTTNVYVKLSGTSSDLIWFRGVAGSFPRFKAPIKVITGNYAIFENLDFTETPAGEAFSINSQAASHICLRNSTFHNIVYPGYATALVSSNPTQGGNVNNIIIYNNNFSDIGDQFTLTDDDIHCMVFGLWGVTPPTTLHHVWILNNTGVRLGGSFFQFNGDQNDANRAITDNTRELINGLKVTNLDNLHHLYAGKNTVSSARQSLGAPKFSTDVIYSQNVSHDNFSMNTGVGTGMSYQEGSRRVWFLFNKVYMEMFAIRSSNVSFDPVYRDSVNLSSYLIGNVIYKIYNGPTAFTYNRDDIYKPAQAIKHEQGYYNERYIVDNTIYNVGGGITVRSFLEDDIVHISGNVIAGVNGVDKNNLPDYHIYLINGVNKYDYNFFQPHTLSNSVLIRDTTVLPQRLEILNSGMDTNKQCSNCRVGDPLFVNAGADITVDKVDLHPKPGSPLFQANTRSEVYDKFKNWYGIDIAVDFDGRPRPANGPWAIGAFETSGSPVPQIRSIESLPAK